ncbi:hypothetical protein F2Q70_00024707 [Brassica cretica]|uniref:Uncharacterized protein n=1 Tax=Brassica cretica TaxID=69181 RepID=A0A8S9IIS6_BRACR|nr:hypothetical protein F2Q68_00024036 [Brassica cretica]KAF2603179.1 hypothetical protein F2Q70_00024707 [Brassica cretica]
MIRVQSVNHSINTRRRIPTWAPLPSDHHYLYPQPKTEHESRMKKRPGLRHSETGTLSHGFKRGVVSTTEATTKLSPALGCSNSTAFC